MAIFCGFDELTVFVDGDFVHFRQIDDRDSWVKIPRYMWDTVASDIDRQIDEAVKQEANA